MKSFFSLFILLLFSTSFNANHPKIKAKDYGNIKTLYISEFNANDKTISAEELKMEILGQFSKDLAEKLGFKDTIMIERLTYLSYNKEDLYIVENNDSNYKLLLLKEGSLKKSGGSGIAIRIQSAKVNVLDVLKLVEYAIINEKKLNRHLKSKDYFFSKDEKIKVLANTNQFISTIISQHSDIIQNLMQKEFILFRDSNKIISWQNNEFVFKENLEKFKPDNVYRNGLNDELKLQGFLYYIKNEPYQFFLIFTDKNTFSYFDGNEDHKSLNVVLNDGSSFYPFTVSKEKMNSKIIIYNTKVFFVYDIYKKKLQKIE